MSPAEMAALNWEACDIILVTGDAYVDHPSFGMALIGRVLEAQGFRVGVIAQPDWTDSKAFKRLGRPKLFFGVTSGNMDSMVNRYTAERRRRSDDAYSPHGQPDHRPDRAAIVYSQRCREAYNIDWDNPGELRLRRGRGGHGRRQAHQAPRCRALHQWHRDRRARAEALDGLRHRGHPPEPAEPGRGLHPPLLRTRPIRDGRQQRPERRPRSCRRGSAGTGIRACSRGSRPRSWRPAGRRRWPRGSCRAG